MRYLVLLALLFTPVTQGDTTMTQKSLLTVCSEGTVERNMLCGMYVQGIADAMIADGVICIPDKKAFRQDFLTWFFQTARTVPLDDVAANQPAYNLVANALKSGYSC